MTNWLTWNAVTGCTKYSDGCKNCYALGMALKFQKMGVLKYKNGFKITLHEDALSFPEKIKKPSIIFSNSMTDLFHEDIPFEYLKKIFDIMNKNDQHIFFILTKRAERLLELSKKFEIKDHIWIGVTIESGKYIERLNYLKQVKCKYKYICIEPFIGEINNLNLNGINWVTGGIESGITPRPCKKEWIENIGMQCKKINIPFSFKIRKNNNSFNKNIIYYNEIPKELIEFGKNKYAKNQLNFDF